MAEDDFEARHAHDTAHISYALVYALLNELEKESPGFRRRVWLRAQQSLQEYALLGAVTKDWLEAKIAEM